MVGRRSKKANDQKNAIPLNAFMNNTALLSMDCAVLTHVSSHARRNQFVPDITYRKSDVTSLLTYILMHIDRKSTCARNKI